MNPSNVSLAGSALAVRHLGHQGLLGHLVDLGVAVHITGRLRGLRRCRRTRRGRGRDHEARIFRGRHLAHGLGGMRRRRRRGRLDHLDLAVTVQRSAAGHGAGHSRRASQGGDRCCKQRDLQHFRTLHRNVLQFPFKLLWANPTDSSSGTTRIAQKTPFVKSS